MRKPSLFILFVIIATLVACGGGQDPLPQDTGEPGDTVVDPDSETTDSQEELPPGCEIGGIKVALELLGRAGGPTRPPLTQVSDSDRERIAEILLGHPETQYLARPRA